MTKLVENAVGRLVPAEINGVEAVPYQGVGRDRPTGHQAAPPVRTCADYPYDGNKLVADLKTALEQAGLRDGMTLSTHHHLRNGDYVANALFAAAAELGVKDLRWFPSASFPCHEPQIAHLESLPRTADRPSREWCVAPHRGLDERPSGRLLQRGQNAGYGGAA